METEYDKKVSINSFVRRQTSSSEFTHFAGVGAEKDYDLLCRIHDGIEKGKTKPGYRDGVMLVSVDPEGFFTSLVTLYNGDELVGNFESRREGEAPRKTLRVKRVAEYKIPAKMVEVVLYRHDVLKETGENETEADWEVISINGYPTEEPAPIAPETLMHNHFQSDGGTATNMTPEEFEKALRESFEYHKNKAMLAI